MPHAVQELPTGCTRLHVPYELDGMLLVTCLLSSLAARMQDVSGHEYLASLAYFTASKICWLWQDEYRKHIEKDPALERRFQQVYVSQPSVTDTISILRGLKDRCAARTSCMHWIRSMSLLRQIWEESSGEKVAPSSAVASAPAFTVTLLAYQETSLHARSQAIACLLNAL